MDFVETEERKMLRKTVPHRCSVRHDYYVEKARSGEKASELWAHWPRALRRGQPAD